ncbi:hypothetical protein EVAR_40596_1 [Eumeta japonica]|uniref:Uncharacterized protein n=1 Tax=Eumeta variegata TaxID=151549 RepID=A0A4C1XE45_EUMVA|nr:hypothetical protein EVAR_40596_1 [Eumeta japonica]
MFAEQTRGKRADDLSESRWLLPTMHTCNLKGVTSALPASWEGNKIFNIGGSGRWKGKEGHRGRRGNEPPKLSLTRQIEKLGSYFHHSDPLQVEDR